MGDSYWYLNKRIPFWSSTEGFRPSLRGWWQLNRARSSWQLDARRAEQWLCPQSSLDGRGASIRPGRLPRCGTPRRADRTRRRALGQTGSCIALQTFSPGIRRLVREILRFRWYEALPVKFRLWRVTSETFSPTQVTTIFLIETKKCPLENKSSMCVF